MLRHPLQQISPTQILLTSPQHTTLLLPNHNPYKKTHRFLSHTLHYITPIYLPAIPHSMQSAPAAKTNPVFHKPIRLILHLPSPSAWQYTLNATQPSMNHLTVSSPIHRARTPAHRFLERTTKYPPNNQPIQSSTYTSPDLPPTLVARLALCTGIHSNKYRPLKSS